MIGQGYLISGQRSRLVDAYGNCRLPRLLRGARRSLPVPVARSIRLQRSLPRDFGGARGGLRIVHPDRRRTSPCTYSVRRPMPQRHSWSALVPDRRTAVPRLRRQLAWRGSRSFLRSIRAHFNSSAKAAELRSAGQPRRLSPHLLSSPAPAPHPADRSCLLLSPDADSAALRGSRGSRSGIGRRA